jgi:hypothetical protein
MTLSCVALGCISCPACLHLMYCLCVFHVLYDFILCSARLYLMSCMPASHVLPACGYLLPLRPTPPSPGIHWRRARGLQLQVWQWQQWHHSSSRRQQQRVPVWCASTPVARGPRTGARWRVSNSTNFVGNFSMCLGNCGHAFIEGFTLEHRSLAVDWAGKH